MARSLLNQGEIIEGVEQLHRRVDACIDACHVLLFPVIALLSRFLNLRGNQVRITRELAQAQKDIALVAQRDHAEIRDMILELRSSFTDYVRNQDVLPSNDTFQAVVQNIHEVCQYMFHQPEFHPFLFRKRKLLP
jgi:hypothetical protein